MSQRAKPLLLRSVWVSELGYCALDSTSMPGNPRGNSRIVGELSKGWPFVLNYVLFLWRELNNGTRVGIQAAMTPKENLRSETMTIDDILSSTFSLATQQTVP
jgi:hypothetical protein